MPYSTPASPTDQMGRPVNTALREGVHDGEAQKEFVNRAPSRATLSNAGVLTTLSPYAPVWGKDISSAITKRILGRDARREQAANPIPAALVIKLRRFMAPNLHTR